MKCKTCDKNRGTHKFRKNSKKCYKCEYATRKIYINKYQKENKERLREYNRIFQKSKNYYYIPKPKIIKPVIIKPVIKEPNLFLTILLLI